MLRLQISLLLFILNGRTKMKLAILAFFGCVEFVKISIRHVREVTMVAAKRSVGVA